MRNPDRYSPFMLLFAKITGALSAFAFFKTRVMHESAARPDRKGGGIVIANHSALMDYVLMLTVFPLRVLRYMIAEVIFGKNKMLSWLLYRIGGIRVDRENAANAGYVSRVEEAARRGHLIGIFPEGRLNTRPEGELLEFRTGAAYFALKHNLPVIPVYHEYKYGILKRVRVMVGDPVNLRELFPGEIDARLLAAATEYLRERVQSLRVLLEKRVSQQEEKKHSRRSYRALSAFIRATTWPVLLALFHPKYYYTDENVLKRVLPEPSVLVSNHTNYLDPPMLCSVFRKNRLHMIAGEILYDNPILHWLLPHYGCIKVDRNSIDMDSFRKMTETLRARECVGLFPEGGLNTSGELMPFKAGMVLAAVKTGAPLIPVYIGGSYRVFGPRLRIVIDRPFEFDRSSALTGDFLDKTAAGIRLRMIEMKNLIEKETQKNV